MGVLVESQSPLIGFSKNNGMRVLLPMEEDLQMAAILL
jgi:hypothetical protein